MPFYQQEVIETRTYAVLYTVEAANVEEAMNKIAVGDTVKEEELKLERVNTRDEWGDLVEVDAVVLEEDPCTCTCDECGNDIPDDPAGSITNKHHKGSCSLYDATKN